MFLAALFVSPKLEMTSNVFQRTKRKKKKNMNTGEKKRCTPEIPAFGRLRKECKF